MWKIEGGGVAIGKRGGHMPVVAGRRRRRTVVDFGSKPCLIMKI